MSVEQDIAAAGRPVVRGETPRIISAESVSKWIVCQFVGHEWTNRHLFEVHGNIRPGVSCECCGAARVLPGGSG